MNWVGITPPRVACIENCKICFLRQHRQKERVDQKLRNTINTKGTMSGSSSSMRPRITWVRLWLLYIFYVFPQPPPCNWRTLLFKQSVSTLTQPPMMRLRGMRRYIIVANNKTVSSILIKVTLEAQLGLIGGTMGLLTGFSILSGIEIVYYLIKLVKMQSSFDLR